MNDPLEPPVHGINLWLPSAANYLKQKGFTAEEVIRYLNGREHELRRNYQQGEVERAVAFVFGTVSAKPSARRRKRPKVEFDPDWLATVAARMPEADADWFKARSPLDVTAQTADSFLKALFYPGEKALCFTKYKSQGQLLWSHDGGGNTLEGWATGLVDGGWFLAQPVTGEYTHQERFVKPHNPTGRSRRCAECMTAFRYVLLESDKDEVPPALWLSVLSQLPLPIASVVTSGGKSVHSLIRIDATTKQKWEAAKDAIFSLAIPLGADKASMKVVQLTRLPFVHRGAHLQELLYLDPDPVSSLIKMNAPLTHFPTLR